MEKLIEMAGKLGLEGQSLLQFISEQQQIERDERAREREARKAEAEAAARREEAAAQKANAEAAAEERRLAAEAAAEERRLAAEAVAEEKRLAAAAEERHIAAEAAAQKAKYEYELEIKRLESTTLSLNGSGHGNGDGGKAKTPKLPNFVDYKDEMDSYLQRFERFAEDNNWPRTIWASSLSALLSGRALDVYGRMSDREAKDYDLVKRALFKRYNLTEDGYRSKFRTSKPDGYESSDQFIVRLSTYMM